MIAHQRNFSRTYTELPIMFSDQLSNSYSDAHMYNTSAEGMYFESVFELPAGFDICIKCLNDAPDMDYAPEAYKICHAKVVWCKQVENKTPHHYGVGVKFLKTRSIECPDL